MCPPIRRRCARCSPGTRSRTTAASTRPRRACTSATSCSCCSCAGCSSPATSRSGSSAARPASSATRGPTAERTLNTKETVAEWVGYLRAQVERFLSFEGDNAARIVNNLDWTAPLSAIDFLREIGKHYRVGTMLKKDAVSARLNSDAGISYTEFSYQILQGLDYLELYRSTAACCRPAAATSGATSPAASTSSTTSRASRARDRHAAHHQLRRHASSARARATRSGSTRRCAARTAMYQFWLNTDDADVIARLKIFTFLTRAEIEEYERLVAAEPFRRAGAEARSRSRSPRSCTGRMPRPRRSRHPRRSSARAT